MFVPVDSSFAFPLKSFLNLISNHACYHRGTRSLAGKKAGQLTL